MRDFYSTRGAQYERIAYGVGSLNFSAEIGVLLALLLTGHPVWGGFWLLFIVVGLCSHVLILHRMRGSRATYWIIVDQGQAYTGPFPTRDDAIDYARDEGRDALPGSLQVEPMFAPEGGAP